MPQGQPLLLHTGGQEQEGNTPFLIYAYIIQQYIWFIPPLGIRHVRHTAT